METKVCFKCGETKPLKGGFYRHRQMADGHLNKCVTCSKIDVLAWATKNPEKRKAIRSKWDRQRDLSGPKTRARYDVRNAIRRGELSRKPCESCGSVIVEAHHDDHLKPLEIRWLCRTHHELAHHTEYRAEAV